MSQQSQQVSSIFNFLTSGSKVAVVQNATDPNNIRMITPFLNQDGSAKTDNNGREIGSIRLEQLQRTLNGSFVNASTRVTFISGTIEELQNILNQNKLVHGSNVPGKIVIRESLTPFFPNQRPKMNPQTEETIGFTVGDTFYPVYMQMSYVTNENEPDVLLRDIAKVESIVTARNTMAMEARQMGSVVETARIPATETAE